MTNSRRHVLEDVPYRDRRAGPLGPAGSTLIEVLVATLVLVSGVLGIAQLFLTASATNAASRDATLAATLTAQKVEQLLSSDLSVATEVFDHIDGWGRVLGTGESPPPGAVYTRRWSIEPVTGETVAIRVRVGRTDRSGASGRMPAEIRVATIRVRRPS